MTTPPVVVAFQVGNWGTCYWLREAIKHDHPLDVVPCGFVSDGYSVPAILWPMIRGLKTMVPAFRHDWRYMIGWRSQAECDQMLYEDMRADGVSWYTATKVWLGLRLGGWVAYKRWYWRRVNAGLKVIDPNTQFSAANDIANLAGQRIVANHNIAHCYEEAIQIVEDRRK